MGLGWQIALDRQVVLAGVVVQTQHGAACWDVGQFLGISLSRRASGPRPGAIIGV